LRIHLESVMSIEGVLTIFLLSVRLACNHESLALEKYHPASLLSGIAVARGTHIRGFLESSECQMLLTWQRISIQNP
jgi:hypothetical protein